MSGKIRIKDIAARAGVSVGTVDRVLHKRLNDSEESKRRVEEALKEMDYKPNVYASALAYNKSYRFCCLLPKHTSEAYWEEIELGITKAIEFRRDFQLDITFKFYSRLNSNSFKENYEDCLKENPDGVILVPSNLKDTKRFTDQLHENSTPFVLLDSYLPELNPLSFYGQDSLQSGFFAAKMLMLIAKDENSIMLMKQTKDGKVPSTQQENREVGFRHYMNEHFPAVKIIEVNLPLDEERKSYEDILESFFQSHPQIHHCITLNSKAHIVGEFLLNTKRRNIQIMGYDVVHKNAKCLRQSSISFLIAQHAFQQGFSSVDALFRAIVLKKNVQPINYMPIELLSKENIDFYHRMRI